MVLPIFKLVALVLGISIVSLLIYLNVHAELKVEPGAYKVSLWKNLKLVVSISLIITKAFFYPSYMKFFSSSQKHKLLIFISYST